MSPITGRSGSASLTPIEAGRPQPMPPPRRPKKLCGSSLLTSWRMPRARRHGLVDHHGVLGQDLADRVDQRERLHRRLRSRASAPCARSFSSSARVGLARALEPVARGALRAARHALAHRRGEFGQRALRIAEDRDLGGIVLAELPRIDVEVDHASCRAASAPRRTAATARTGRRRPRTARRAGRRSCASPAASRAIAPRNSGCEDGNDAVLAINSA